MITSNLNSQALVGHHLRLEPLIPSHRDALRLAADDERIWQFMPQNATRHYFDAWFDDCIEKSNNGSQIIYIVRQISNQQIIGSTAYYDISLEHKHLTLGYSWYIYNAWGTIVNSECKLLMLTQAFEHWNMNRVEIGTDTRNIRSYHAIKALGATFEGTLRQHMILHDGSITDTHVFSILANEWPNVKKTLYRRLLFKDPSFIVPSHIPTVSKNYF